MQHLITILVTSLFSINLLAQSRIERHQNAINELKSLNFFKDGKGMVVSPNIIKLYEVLKKTGVGTADQGALNRRWGMNLVNNEVQGLYNIPYKKMQMGVLGCVACHSGKAAGEYIIGLGNKNIDVGQVGQDAYRAQFLWGMVPRINPEFKQIHNRAMHFTSVLKNEEINNLTQGLVATSLVKTWFYEILNLPLPKNFGRGQVKVPHLWGYGEKRLAGSFWDGLARGELPGWAVAVELRGGQTPENVRSYVDKVHHAEDSLKDLLPPNYPFVVNAMAAQKGREHFQNYCISCHGDHQRDESAMPVYLTPKVIPIQTVKTDNERLNFVTDEFLGLIDRNPLNDLIQYIPREEKGYFAPKLWGIWARFPYLHNASVPTIDDLLKPAIERPVVFNLANSGEKERFDETKLGLKIERNTQSTHYKQLLKKAKKGQRSIYYTERIGHNNSGHEFRFYSKLTEETRRELIEYLKTL